LKKQESLSLNTMNTTHYPRLFSSLCLGILISCAQLLAQSKDDLKITLTAEKVTVQKDGKEALVAATRAKPGEVIQYTAVYLNQSKGTLRNLAPTLPIPSGMEYIADSAKPAATQASLDRKVFESITDQTPGQDR
jgi:uncharacterized repeat protein (TIGR01451 family)